MDPREHGALTCIKAAARARVPARCTLAGTGIPAEYFEASGRIFLSLDRAEARAPVEYTAVQFAEPEVTCARTLIKARRGER